MPTIVDKDRALDLLSAEFAAINAVVAGLTDDQWDRPSCLPGWTVKDVLSHMVGTELMLAGARPPETDVPVLDHVRNPVAEANEVWVASMRAVPGSEVAARWASVTAGRLDALQAMTQAEFDAPSWTPVGNDETYGRFMRIRHFDCYMHEHDIRFALGRTARAEPDHLVFCLDEVATGLGYIVGRRAGLPDGSRVLIELEGEPRVSYRIEVEGRARVVDTLSGPATVGIGLSPSLFLRLTGGRDDGASGPGGDIRLSGDPDLARQLAEHLAFTI
jgi:uncharacterized protein (TIGR03083 family)